MAEPKEKQLPRSWKRTKIKDDLLLSINKCKRFGCWIFDGLQRPCARLLSLALLAMAFYAVEFSIIGANEVHLHFVYFSWPLFTDWYSRSSPCIERNVPFVGQPSFTSGQRPSEGITNGGHSMNRTRTLYLPRLATPSFLLGLLIPYKALMRNFNWFCHGIFHCFLWGLHLIYTVKPCEWFLLKTILFKIDSFAYHDDDGIAMLLSTHRRDGMDSTSCNGCVKRLMQRCSSRLYDVVVFAMSLK